MERDQVAQHLSEEQGKLFRLARAARARIEAVQGAAVVDETGRTYSAASVVLPRLALTAVELAVASAAAAGARQLTGCVLVAGEPEPLPTDSGVFADLAAHGAELVVCAPDGTVVARWTSP